MELQWLNDLNNYQLDLEEGSTVTIYNTKNPQDYSVVSKELLEKTSYGIPVIFTFEEAHFTDVSAIIIHQFLPLSLPGFLSLPFKEKEENGRSYVCVLPYRDIPATSIFLGYFEYQGEDFYATVLPFDSFIEIQKLFSTHAELFLHFSN